jgi:hypothetical protein
MIDFKAKSLGLSVARARLAGSLAAHVFKPSSTAGGAFDYNRVLRPEAKKVSRKAVGRQPKKFSKRELYAMLADAVRNTG